MIYPVLAIAVLGMVGYMFWSAAYAMRKERIRNQREATRGVHAFTRKHRARLLLQRAFGSPEEPSWLPVILERLGDSAARERPRH